MAAILRMIVVLSVLCAVSGFALSYLKQVTAKPIEEQVLTYVQGPALSQVFPDVDNSPIAERKLISLPDGRAIMVFPAKKNNELIGVAMENFAPGYGGDVGIMVGFDIQRDTLSGIGVTTMKETPGMGTRILEPAFSDQFANTELPVALSSQGGRIDAVSGATVSSVAAVEAVGKAVADYQALKADILTLWP